MPAWRLLLTVLLTLTLTMGARADVRVHADCPDGKAAAQLTMAGGQPCPCDGDAPGPSGHACQDCTSCAAAPVASAMPPPAVTPLTVTTASARIPERLARLRPSALVAGPWRPPRQS